MKHLLDERKAKGMMLEFIKVKSHTGVVGNEAADALAACGAEGKDPSLRLCELDPDHAPTQRLQTIKRGISALSGFAGATATINALSHALQHSQSMNANDGCLLTSRLLNAAQPSGGESDSSCPTFLELWSFFGIVTSDTAGTALNKFCTSDWLKKSTEYRFFRDVKRPHEHHVDKQVGCVLTLAASPNKSVQQLFASWSASCVDNFKGKPCDASRFNPTQLPPLLCIAIDRSHSVFGSSRIDVSRTLDVPMCTGMPYHLAAIVEDLHSGPAARVLVANQWTVLDGTHHGMAAIDPDTVPSETVSILFYARPLASHSTIICKEVTEAARDPDRTLCSMAGEPAPKKHRVTREMPPVSIKPPAVCIPRQLLMNRRQRARSRRVALMHSSRFCCKRTSKKKRPAPTDRIRRCIRAKTILERRTAKHIVKQHLAMQSLECCAVNLHPRKLEHLEWISILELQQQERSRILAGQFDAVVIAEECSRVDLSASCHQHLTSLANKLSRLAGLSIGCAPEATGRETIEREMIGESASLLLSDLQARMLIECRHGQRHAKSRRRDDVDIKNKRCRREKTPDTRPPNLAGNLVPLRDTDLRQEMRKFVCGDWIVCWWCASMAHKKRMAWRGQFRGGGRYGKVVWTHEWKGERWEDFRDEEGDGCFGPNMTLPPSPEIDDFQVLLVKATEAPPKGQDATQPLPAVSNSVASTTATTRRQKPKRPRCETSDEPPQS